MKNARLISLLLTGAVMFSCDPTTIIGGDDNGGGNGGNGGNGGSEELVAQNIGGTMSENTTLKDLGLPIDYIVEGELKLDGNALVTIEPGVCIAFKSANSGIYVGENAGITMVGTEDKPIVLRGPINNNNPGSWKWVDIYSARNDNRMEHVEFLNGGSDANYGVILVENDAKLSMKHCTVNGSLGKGVYSNGTLTAFENNTIKNVKKYPLYLSRIFGTTLGKGNTYADNGSNFIQIDRYTSENNDGTLTNQGIPYEVVSDIDVTDQRHLTVEPGTTIAFAAVNGKINVRENARITMVGTADEPIVVRGPINNNNPGSWEYIDVYSKRKDNNIEYVQFINGGSDKDWGVVIVEGEAKLTLKNCTINGSLGCGVVSYGDGSLMEFENNTIKNVEKYPLKMGFVSTNNLGKGNVYVDNQSNYILVNAIGDGTSTMTYQGIPYEAEYGLSLNDKSTLTIEPGVVLRMADDSQFDIYEQTKLYAIGTPEAPITFCGQDEGSGQWDFLDVMTEKACELENVIIDQCGQGGYGGGIWYNGASTALSMKNVVIRNSDAFGIKMSVDTEWNEATEKDEYVKPAKFSYENVTFENCKKGNIELNDKAMDAFPW